MDEALRGDFALGHLVARAVPVGELEALAAEDGGGDELEMPRLVAPCTEGDHVDPPAHFLGRVVPHGEQRRQSRLQRLHVRAEDAGLEALEQMLHGEERLRLARAEPQPRQLVLGRRWIRSVESVAALLAVPRDGRVVAASHVLDVALERRERHLQLAQEVVHRNDAALADQLVDLVEPFGTIHPPIINQWRNRNTCPRISPPGETAVWTFT